MSKVSLNFVNIEIKFSQDFEKGYWSFEYVINYYSPDYSFINDRPIQIGGGEGHRFTNPLNYDRLVEISDEISDSTYELCVESDPDFINQEPGAHIVTLEAMKIDPEYRGEGVGLMVMKFLLDFFEGDIVLIKPYPIDGSCPEDQIDGAIVKLQKYWSKCGFEQMGIGEIYYYSSWSCPDIKDEG